MSTDAVRVASRTSPEWPHAAAPAEAYRASGAWSDVTAAELVRANARRTPGGTAYFTPAARIDWASYDDAADTLAAVLVGAGLTRGARLGVLLPDGPTAHVAYVAAERAGLVVVGLSPRSGLHELVHVLATTQASALLTAAQIGARDAAELLAVLRANGLASLRSVVVPDLAADHPATIEVDGAPAKADGGDRAPLAGRTLAASDLFLINSTSGTTGLPKCVMHSQLGWANCARCAIDGGELTPDDVIFSAVPTPYGFGLWSAHFLPALLGSATGLLERFDVEALLDLLERERVTMLACVTTQLVMMLGAPSFARRDLAALRVVYTGGEAVPYARSATFEDTTGAKVLQFYGSNETGAVSQTTVRDLREQRLRTVGHPLPATRVRLYDGEHDVTASGGPAQLAVRGPGVALGYYGDEQANRALVTPDGWMLTGDVVELDEDGCLRIVGRAADIIIRGGKNISAAAVEDEALTHPAVAMAAAVAMPDPVFGERVCLYVELHDGEALTLTALTDHLLQRGLSREWLPERLIALAELPQSAGGKLAKAELRNDIRRRLEAEAINLPATRRDDQQGECPCAQ